MNVNTTYRRELAVFYSQNWLRILSGDIDIEKVARQWHVHHQTVSYSDAFKIALEEFELYLLERNE